MSKFDDSIELWPHELDNALDSSAAQTVTPSKKRGSGRPRQHPQTSADWRNEQDPVKRKRLRNNFNSRQYRKRARDAEINAQNEALTKNALEVQQAEDTMEQDTQLNGG
jgi:hypothetical protein